MTDPWARPVGRHQVVDVELTGAEPMPARTTRTSADPSSSPSSSPSPNTSPATPPNTASSRRRRSALVGLGAIVAAGLVIALVVAVTNGGSDGDGAATDPANTTFDASGITTPPTLETLPTVESLPAATGEGAGSGPGVIDESFADELAFDPTTITVPVFDVVAGVTEDELAAYDLPQAVAANAPGGTPMRTIVTFAGVQIDGLFNNEADVVVANDPAAGRDSLRIERNVGEPAEFVVDRGAGVVYRTDAGMNGQWETFTPDAFTTGTGTDDLDDLFDALVTGPVNAATLEEARIGTGGGLVRLDGGAIARRFSVTIPIDALRPYGLLLMANISEQTVASGAAPEAITFEVYVTDQARLALVTARFEVDNLVFVLEQIFDRRPANVIIDLPAPDAVIDGAVTGAPAPAPTTTVPLSVP